MSETLLQRVSSKSRLFPYGYEDTLSNLRLIGGIKKHEYIQTDNEGNILSYLEHNFKNCVSSDIYGQNWKTTLFCLRKLYVNQLPKLLKELNISNKSNTCCAVKLITVPEVSTSQIKPLELKELKKIGALLEKSLLGLENLKSVYQGTNNLAHIETINETCKNQLNKIIEAIKKNDSARLTK